MLPLFSFIYFALFGNLAVLIHGEHVHHKHSHHRKDPPTRIKQGNGPVSPFSEHTPPQSNLDKEFSWSNPALLAHLWGGAHNIPKDGYHEVNPVLGQRSLKKRAYKKLGPALQARCIFCTLADKQNDPNLELSDFDWRNMIRRAIQPIRYEKPCLFYSQRPPANSGRRLPPTDTYKLSDIATEYACGNKMRSIWMIWEWDKNSCRNTNYYCLFDKCCWLFPLKGEGSEDDQKFRVLQYFQAMSKALANTCRGKVYIMTDSLKSVPTSPYPQPVGDQEVLDWQGKPANPSIWLTHELPMLRELYKFGTINSFTTISPSGGNGYDLTVALDYPEYPSKIPASKLPTRDLHERNVEAGNNSTHSEPWKMNLTATEPQVIHPDMEITDFTRQVWEMLRFTEQLKTEYASLPQDQKDEYDRKERLSGRADACSGACAYQRDGWDYFG